ncbi:MAG: SUMF1/EgtB/PvdO family nonheme iron enzyme [Selenomonadaceae bacterium]|nr:SUMF1/EgtB/PvdO family nonheme iron enzyme [Selenomonadaceae bacterium]
MAVVSFVVTSVVALGQDSDILVQPPLSWSVNSVRVVWTVTAGATKEEKSTSLYDESTSGSTQRIQTEMNRTTNESGTSFSVGGGVDASFGLTTNPFTLFGLTGTKAKASAFIEGNYTNKSKDTNESSDEWTAIEKESISKAFSTTVAQAQQVTISDLKLVFTVDFTNHTSHRLFFSPQSNNFVPVYCGSSHLGYAKPIEPNFTIAAKRTIPCQFEMPIDDTAKMEILKKRPKIKIEGGQLIIQSNPNVREPIEDAIQESLPSGDYFTIELVMQGESKLWYINWYKKNPVTLKEAFEVINDAVCSENNDDSRILFEMKDDVLVRVCNTPFELDETTDWKIQYRRFQGRIEQKVNALKPLLAETPNRGARITFQFVDTRKNKLLKKAESDDVQAMFNYAQLLLNDESTENDKQAFEWLVKASNENHHEAQYLRALCLLKGIGVEKNPEEAVIWLKKSAINGEIAEAYYHLGVCYFEGVGTEKKNNWAAIYLTHAIKGGFSEAQEVLDRIPGRQKVEIINGVEFAFRWCPAGTFMMGSPVREQERDNDEYQHQVTLTKGFWVLETEVTQKQWKAIMGRTVTDQAQRMLNNKTYYSFPGRFFNTTISDYLGYSSNTKVSSIVYGVGDNYPIYWVSLLECQQFCDECQKLGLNIQLPTEAQWEYACRAGSTTSLYNIKGDNAVPSLDSIAWFEDNSLSSAHPVGKKEPNAWGIYDMIGNVWELCSDRYQSYTEQDSKIDPIGCGNKPLVRGGSWFNRPKYCRSAYRESIPIRAYCTKGIGFRVIIPQE